MLPPSFYCKENVLRARYVHLSVAVTAADGSITIQLLLTVYERKRGQG